MKLAHHFLLLAILILALVDLTPSVTAFSTTGRHFHRTAVPPFQEKHNKILFSNSNFHPRFTLHHGLATTARRRRRRDVRTHNDNTGYNYNLESITGDPFQTLIRLFKTTTQYTVRQFVQWCNRPLTQVQQWSILLVYYFFHLMVLSQQCILFPWQLIPNNKGHFCSVGWDSIAGIVAMAIFISVKRGSVYFRKPWRRLIEHITPSPTDDVALEPPSSPSPSPSAASAKVAAAKKADLDAVVSKVLEKAPRKVLLQRSTKAPTKPMNESAVSKDESESVKVSSTNVSSTVNSLNKTTTTTESSPTATPVITAPTTINSSSSIAVSPYTSVPSSSVAQTFAISSSLLNETATKTTNNKTAMPANSVALDSQVQQPNSDPAVLIDSTTLAKEASKPADVVFSFDSLSKQLKPLSDALQEQFQKTMSFIASSNANANNNNTRIDNQGIGELSALGSSLPTMTPAGRRRLWTKGSTLLSLFLLVNTYFATGRFSFFWEDSLYAMAGVGFPLTIAMHRSLCVLLGHLTWVAIGSTILGVVLRPKFFGRNTKWYRQTTIGTTAEEEEASEGASAATKPRKRSNWIWWVIGGYSVSAWFFNIADFVNLYALPQQVLEDAILQEGVVTQLINPENNDFLASVVGYIAPCLSAPWWEEILYRAFFFPALSLFLPVWASVLLSGIVFSAHHVSLTAALPLAVLGWTWAGLYMASDNLWSTIAVHALWNSRVFLSSWLGV